MDAMERRVFLKGAGMGMLAFTVGGASVLMTPGQARAQGVPFRLLNAKEAETIEALGETLVPGARQAGVAHFIDQQVSVTPGEALLEARQLNVKPPFVNFYRAAIGSVDKASEARSGRRFAALPTTDQRDFVDLMRQNKIEGWQGSAGGFVYLVLRSDAVDVVSATDKHANGLANSSGLVGKYLMTHFASGTNAMFSEDVENHMGTIGAQFMSYERYGKTAHKGAFGSTFIVAGSAIKVSGLGGLANTRPDLFGPELVAYMKRATKNLSRMNAFGEEQPKIENRLELASEKDEFGMPLGRIIHNYDDNDAALWNANFEEGLRIAKATDAKDVWQGRGAQPTIHLMGGTIMGTGAGNSVVNSFGQTHEIPNLYAAGPGIFATSGASNPTYTCFALTMRGAENLAGNWSTVAG